MMSVVLAGKLLHGIPFGEVGFLNFCQLLEDIATLLLLRGAEGAGTLDRTLHVQES